MKTREKKKKKKLKTALFIFLLIISVISVAFLTSILINRNEYRKHLNQLTRENKSEVPVYDIYGGWVNYPESFGEIEPGDYFRVEKIKGAWWFITPAGTPFISKGVTDISGAPALDGISPFMNKESAEAAKEALFDWGFNTVGPWSLHLMADIMPNTVLILDCANSLIKPPGTFIVDFWSQAFEFNAKMEINKRVKPRINDKNLIGYFMENEIVWGSDHFRTQKTLIRQYFELNKDAPGREEVIRFLIEEAESVEKFNTVWDSDISEWADIDTLNPDVFTEKNEQAKEVEDKFKVLAMDRYVKVAVTALKAVDPDRLVLGVRFHTYPGDALMRASAKHFDVISLNYYESMPPVKHIDKIAEEIDKPILIGEWTFRAHDAGLLNTGIYSPRVKTQEERALSYMNYVREFISRPYAVGYHWYKWDDNIYDLGKKMGDNIGLVNHKREPYLVFIDFISQVNRRVEAWHYEGVNN